MELGFDEGLRRACIVQVTEPDVCHDVLGVNSAVAGNERGGNALVVVDSKLLYRSTDAAQGLLIPGFEEGRYSMAKVFGVLVAAQAKPLASQVAGVVGRQVRDVDLRLREIRHRGYAVYSC